MPEFEQQPRLLPIESVPRRILSPDERARPIWELIAARGEAVPVEERDRIPHDGAEHHDQYLYRSCSKADG